MIEMKSPLPPIVNENCRALILGSFPSLESIATGEYYANSRNHFWRIVYSIYEAELESPYERRISFTLHKQIAVWDVVESCCRESSLDSKIRKEHPNNFNRFFKQYSELRFVFFNGKKAWEVFEDHVHLDEGFRSKLTFKILPSTSPANAIPFERKLASWREVRASLDSSKRFRR